MPPKRPDVPRSNLGIPFRSTNRQVRLEATAEHVRHFLKLGRPKGKSMRRSTRLACQVMLGLVVIAWAKPGVRAIAEGWPQWLGAGRDGVWHETGLIDHFPKTGPKIVWRTPLGAGYSGPAVEGDRVYITDRQRAKGPNGEILRPTRQGIPGKERVLCLNATDGKVIWNYDYDCPYTISYPSGPRTTPFVDGKSVYSLGAMGDLI